MSGDGQMRIQPPRSAFLSALGVGCILVLGLELPRSLRAQAPAQAKVDEGWVGQRVVQRVAKLTLRMNGEPVEGSDGTCHFYRVEQVDGASLSAQA